MEERYGTIRCFNPGRPRKPRWQMVNQKPAPRPENYELGLRFFHSHRAGTPAKTQSEEDPPDPDLFRNLCSCEALEESCELDREWENNGRTLFAGDRSQCSEVA